MSDLLRKMLSDRDVLLTDGATGTNLFAMGLQHGDAPEIWNLEEPDKVRAHYRSFIEAGSDIVLTNTFGGTANRLKLHGAQDRVHEINKAAAELLKAEIEASGREVVCAGSVGPTGDLFEPIGPLTFDDGVAAFRAQIAGLKAGGADVAWIETMSSEDEFKAGLAAADLEGMPAVCTLSFDTNGRTMMGITPEAFAITIHGLEHRPIAFGGNCGTGASDLLTGIISMRGTLNADDILIAKANCGIPEFVDGEIQYSGTRELMAEYVILARNSGARIVGGCCGTTPDHVRAMREALDTTPPGEPPTIHDVVEKLGPLTGSTADLLEEPGSGDKKPERRRSRRRGR